MVGCHISVTLIHQVYKQWTRAQIAVIDDFVCSHITRIIHMTERDKISEVNFFF